MGSEAVAGATGVIRNNTDQLLDDGDIRDQLASNLMERLETNGFDGDLGDTADALYDIARVVFNTRDLNKATTMTFGYGKELESFKNDIGEFLDLNYETLKNDPNSTFAQSVDSASASMKEGRQGVIDALHNFYVGSLAEVLSDEAIESRSLMRSAAMLHAITNQLFSITGPTGFQLNMGGEASLGFDKDTATTYSFNQDGRRTKVTAGQYETESTAAAIRRQTDEEGNVTETPGEDAYGGSVPAPVQSLDAATVAMSAAGRSWDKMKAASNGNPYMHTIYDAFKLDAMGFDVGVQEINNNWLNASMNWSYLEETYAATKEKMTDWNKAMDQLPQGQNLDTTMAGQYRMIGWLLEPGTTGEGQIKFYPNLINKLGKILEVPKGIDSKARHKIAKDAADNINTALQNAGVNTGQPVEQMTVRQVRVFVNAMVKELELSGRLSKMINKTDANKKRLKKVIDAQKRHKGNEVLQYYAH